MDNSYHYLYALTWASRAEEGLGPGVDPRFPVQRVNSGRVAAVVSRVGLDQFDLSKLEEGAADMVWLGKVALRHNQIVEQVAQQAPVLPLRLGTVFKTRESMLAKIDRCEAEVVRFLQWLGGRREWSLKVYSDADRAPSTSRLPGGTRSPATAARGTAYLAAQRERIDGLQQSRTAVAEELSALEERLQPFSRQWRRLRLLSGAITGRREKMVWNGAFLFEPAVKPAFQATCDQLGRDLRSLGLVLETSGPWPPYHFCPTLE